MILKLIIVFFSDNSLFIYIILLYAYATMYLFYSDIFIHLDYFQFYANMNTAAQNTYIYLSFGEHVGTFLLSI